MKILPSFCIMCILFLTSCNQSPINSTRDLELHDEALKASVKDEIKNEEQRAKNLRTAKNNLGILQSNLDNARANLVVENDKLSRIRDFHFLRSPADRDNQIRNQVLRIEGLQRDIRSYEIQIRTTRGQIAEFEKQNQQ